MTECTGGPEELIEQDLPLRYNSFCDPRLNYAQSIEIAFRLAQDILKIKSKKRIHSNANEVYGEQPVESKVRHA